MRNERVRKWDRSRAVVKGDKLTGCNEDQGGADEMDAKGTEH